MKNKLQKILCALFGHPRVVINDFGYKYCARCNEQLGDSLGGYWTGDGFCELLCDCDECKGVKRILKWHEKLLTKLK